MFDYHKKAIDFKQQNREQIIKQIKDIDQEIVQRDINDF